MGGAMVNLVEIEELVIAVKDAYDTFNTVFYRNLGMVDQLKNIRRIKLDSKNADWIVVEGLVAKYVAALGDDGQLDREVFDQLRQRYDFRYRVKLLATVRTKIAYNLDKQRYVAKVLNDFLGTRLILPGIEDEQVALNKLLEDLRERKIISRYYVRNDGNYRATHCYLQSDNRFFPWELQIWDKKRENLNRLEHKRHVRERSGLEKR